MASAGTKERAYELIARLPPEKVAVAVEALEKLAEPVSRRLADIPLEDEEISAAEEDAVARAKADGSAPTSMADFLVELGLTQADVDGVVLGVQRVDSGDCGEASAGCLSVGRA